MTPFPASARKVHSPGSELEGEGVITGIGVAGTAVGASFAAAVTVGEGAAVAGRAVGLSVGAGLGVEVGRGEGGGGGTAVGRSVGGAVGGATTGLSGRGVAVGVG